MSSTPRNSKGILRLSHVEIRVPDLELALAYYVEVVGLQLTVHDGDRVYLKAWDEHQHHSVILLEAPTYGIESVGFKVHLASDLDDLASKIEAVGVATQRHAAGDLGPGSGDTVRFTAPSGHVMDLVHGMDQVGNGMPKLNPPIAPLGLKGMHPPRIDHLFLMAEDVDGVTSFFADVLGFRLTEEIVADDGFQLATFLERSHHTHDIAFLVGPDGGFHHVAFWVDDWNELRNGADLCAFHGVTVDVGPTRHGATRGCGMYFFDPAGNRNELFTGGYWFDPGDKPTRWTEAEMGRAIFYYKGKVDPAFMSVHS